MTSPRVVSSSLPRVAIVGRPNVGKSTLLNRVVGRRDAIVEEKPGVTRDRKEHVVDWGGRRFVLVDTGGWESAPEDAISSAVRREAERAIAIADVVLVTCDATVGVTQEDAEAARLVLRSGVPAVLAVNKVDGPRAEYDLSDFYALGLGDPYPVSALHGRRSGDLLDAVIDALPDVSDEADGVEVPGEIAEASVAIVGRPNVGKSTLFNRLIGEERSIVHDAPGTTRDAIDTVVELEGHTYRFVDTAGLRRKAKVDDRTEYYSRVRAIDALERADAALLVLDGTAGVTFADQKVAEEVHDAGRACVILLNKWDLLDREGKLAFTDELADKLHFLDWAPVLRISARTGSNAHKIVPTLERVLEEYRRRVPTHQLMRVVEEAVARHPPPMVHGQTKVKYVTQPRHSPPTFVVFANRRLEPSYLRYLERRIREAYGFDGTPVRIKLRVATKEKAKR